MDLFGKKKEEGLPSLNQTTQNGAPQNQKGQPIQQNNFAKEINEITRRIRINEERSVNIRNKSQMIEHNMLINHKKLLNEIKFVNEEIGEVKRSFEELKTKVMGFARELQQVAKKEDVQVLERYISMWEPMKFITSDEVERIIEEKLNERLNNKK